MVLAYVERKFSDILLYFGLRSPHGVVVKSLLSSIRGFSSLSDETFNSGPVSI